VNQNAGVEREDNMAIGVMIVEDESGIRKLLRKIIERMDGFEVVGESDNLPDAISQFNKTSAEVQVGKTITLKETINPSNASNKGVTWKSSDKTVATVSSTGVVTGKKAGNVTITVTTNDGKKTATCKIKVTK
jgi:uncharacterized protein YjdB